MMTVRRKTNSHSMTDTTIEISTAVSENSNDSKGHRLRLREKFNRAGTDALNDYEILELLLTYAIPRRDVKPIAKDLIKNFKSLRGVLDAPMSDLEDLDGIGENAATLFKLTKELSKLYLKEKTFNKDVLDSPKAVMDYLNLALSGERVEKFMALYLNSKNEILEIETLFEGCIDRSLVSPRKVIELAFKHNAKSIIFVHNHPSGDPTASKDDITITRDLVNAAKAVDIAVHDHIIVGKGKHVSGRKEGWFN